VNDNDQPIPPYGLRESPTTEQGRIQQRGRRKWHDERKREKHDKEEETI